VQNLPSSYFDWCDSVVSYCRVQQTSRSITTSVDSLKEIACCPMDSSKEDLVEVD
jgi:hypothetical protein